MAGCLPRASLGCAAGILLVLGGWLVAMASTSATAQTSAEVALVEMLRRGGYNIYFRHVATDWSQSDRVEKRDDWLDCDPARMRQLSAAGRADAQAIGVALRSLRIPVGEVLASPYCRTMETARLMDLGPVRASTEVMNLRSASWFGGREAIVTTARRLLSTPPSPGTNRVIVAHGNVANEATPVYPGEGEAVVFEPLGIGFRLSGRVTPEDWRRIDAGMD